MSLAIAVEEIPLHTDRDGVVRVGGTRVTLDTVVHAFHDGASAEEIACRYPALELGEIYSAIAYYLRHQDSVDGYLREREEEARAVRLENESRFPSDGIRARLLARSQR